MSRTATYHTTVEWKGEHWGHIVMGNGPEMDFSAPPDAHGHEGVLTPEDAFVAAANTCIILCHRGRGPGIKRPPPRCHEPDGDEAGANALRVRFRES